MLVSLLAVMPASANVGFRFTSHTIDNGPVKTAMERKLAAILTEIDNAGTNQAPTFDGLGVPPKVVNYFNTLWTETRTPFECVTDTYIEQCLLDVHGYQVRGLKVRVVPQTPGEQPEFRNLVVYFDKGGDIRDIRLAPKDIVELEDIIENGAAVEDMATRLTLLKFVEDFRCYYNEKNIDGLEMIFSDDALIITGKTIEKKVLQNGEMTIQPKVVRTSQTKREYLDKLKAIFRNNKSIKVEFTDINVVRNPGMKDFYGVTLHQSWKTDNYSDEGWIFLYWDFSDEGKPQIMVRTWQDEKTAEQMGLYNINDFSVNR